MRRLQASLVFAASSFASAIRDGDATGVERWQVELARFERGRQSIAHAVNCSACGS
jgi:hypothetical protein